MGEDERGAVVGKFPRSLSHIPFPHMGRENSKKNIKRRGIGFTGIRRHLTKGGEILTVVRRMSSKGGDRKKRDPGVKGKGGFSSSSSPSREKKGKFQNIHLSSFISDRPPKGKEREEESDGN